MYGTDAAKFRMFAAAQFLHLKDQPYVQSCPILKVLGTSLWMSCLEGHTAFLSGIEFTKAMGNAKRLRCMQWTALGWAVDQQMQAGLFNPASLIPDYSAFVRLMSK